MNTSVEDFSFSPKELNNWKARITERLVECYVEQRVAPRIKTEEARDIVILSTITWFSVPNSMGFNPDFSNEKAFFLSNRLFPVPRFLDKFQLLTEALENAPDGFLMKLKRTGESTSFGDAISYMKVQKKTLRKSMSLPFRHEIRNVETIRKNGFAIVRGIDFDANICNKEESLPMVDGDIEVIEVKSGKSNVPPHQIVSYANAMRRGFPLRLFWVEIIDFTVNRFRITEAVVNDPSEMPTRL